MEEIIIIVAVAAVVGYFVGYHMRAIMLIKGMSEDPDHFIRLLEQVKKINTEHDEEMAKLTESVEGTELTIEHVGNMFYAYTKDTKQFIAQGTDMDVLMEQANLRHPNRKFFGVIAKEHSAKELV
jgi:hypothetical protein